MYVQVSDLMAEKVKRVLPWFNITSQAKLINIEDKHATSRLKTMPSLSAKPSKETIGSFQFY